MPRRWVRLLCAVVAAELGWQFSYLPFWWLLLASFGATCWIAAVLTWLELRSHSRDSRRIR